MAIEREARAMRLSPHVLRFSICSSTGRRAFFAGRYSEALSWAEAAIQSAVNYIPDISRSSRGALSGISGSCKAMARLRKTSPSYAFQSQGRIPTRRAEDCDRWVEGMRSRAARMNAEQCAASAYCFSSDGYPEGFWPCIGCAGPS